MADTNFTDYVTPVPAAWLNDINDHVYNNTPISPATTVHPASVITNTPAGNIVATTVQAAIDELDTEKIATAAIGTSVPSPTGTGASGTWGISITGNAATATDAANHIADTGAAHAASAIANTPAGSIAATDVQTAINELDTEKAALAGSASQAFSASTLSAATTIGVGAATPAASGAGITFPATQSASSNANTLDDYEEGTWTPTMTGATVVGTPTYAGYYTKIGRFVRFILYITSTTSFASPDRVSCYFNLPFAPVASPVGTGVLSATNAGSNAEYGQNTISSNDRAYLPVIPATSDIIVTGEYFTT